MYGFFNYCIYLLSIDLVSFVSSMDALDQPVVSLLCVDEAHCLSQWSYNFRPAFLRIRREVQFIQPAAVLALTATATPRIQVYFLW